MKVSGPDSDKWRSNIKNAGDGKTVAVNPASVILSKPRPFNTHTIKERFSYGVACCRNINGYPEMLLICKRYSYSLFLIVLGKYNPSNNASMIKLLNGTTADEKHDLLSLNFAQISYKIWLSKTVRNNVYFTAKNKFETSFVADNGARLRRLILSSTNKNRLWEIPKGRKKNKYENEVHCAIREFHEETRVGKTNYKIWLNGTRSHSYIDDGIKYTNKYFIAFTKYNIVPWIDFSSTDQTDEVGDIKWVGINEMRLIDPDGFLVETARPIFNYVKKYSKK